MNPLLPVDADAPCDRGAPNLAIESYTLANGLRLVLHVDRNLPIVHVNSWYHVGSKDERDGRTGMAHLCEHLMFGGSKHAARGFMTLMERAGANLAEGGVNAATGHDRTHFFASVPPASLGRALWLESDRLAHLTAVLSARKLKRECDVVANERRQRLDERAYGRIDGLVLRHLFPPDHPYAHEVLGTADDLERMRLDEVRAFFQDHYVPNNLSLAIVGDFDPTDAKHLVDQYYGSIPPGRSRIRLRRWVPSIGGARVVEAGDSAPHARIYFAWPSPPLFERGDAELDLASWVLAHGRASRLEKLLVHERRLCSDVGSVQKSMEIAGMFFVWATLRPGTSAAEVEPIVVDEIARLAAEGPTEQELRRAVVNHERQYLSHLDRVGGFGGKGDLLNMYNTYLGDADGFAADLARYRRATADTVRDTLRAFVDPSRRLIVRFRPEKAVSCLVPDVNRETPPTMTTGPRFVPPHVERATLDNGMDVLVVERRDVPHVFGVLVSRAGSVNDPLGKEGLASLTLHALTCGAAGMSAGDVDERLGLAGAALEPAVHAEYCTLRFSAVSRCLESVITTLGAIVGAPRFPAYEVATRRATEVEHLQQAGGRSWSIAMRVSSTMFFGASHPYGRSPHGYPSTLALLTSEDLAAFHDRHWSPRSCALVLVGDVSTADAVRLAARGFGAWSGTESEPTSIPQRHGTGIGRTCVVDRPGSAQTVATIVLPAPARSAPDYYALSLANAVWGGSATGRLAKNLRGRQAYCYGIRSFVTPYSQAGIWKVSGHVNGDKTLAAVRALRHELLSIAGEKPISSSELAAAKRQWVDGYVQQFEASQRVAQEVARLWMSGLPLTELRDEPDAVDALTRADVNAAARTYASPERAGLLLVGDLSAIDEDHARAELGDIVVLDADGERPLEVQSLVSSHAVPA